MFLTAGRRRNLSGWKCAAAWLSFAISSGAQQTLPWIDLSGDWKIIEADDPRYADPAFDDSHWSTLRLPAVLPGMEGFAGSRHLWLRRQLTLTLGKLSENYAVYLNGKPAGQFGRFDRVASYGDGREVELPPGLPLGVVAGSSYEQVTVTIQEGITLVSDGVLEAARTNGELFGFDRTREISTQSGREIAEAAKQWGQNDDITVVTVRRKDA